MVSKETNKTTREDLHSQHEELVHSRVHAMMPHDRTRMDPEGRQLIQSILTDMNMLWLALVKEYDPHTCPPVASPRVGRVSAALRGFFSDRGADQSKQELFRRTPREISDERLFFALYQRLCVLTSLVKKGLVGDFMEAWVELLDQPIPGPVEWKKLWGAHDILTNHKASIQSLLVAWDNRVSTPQFSYSHPLLVIVHEVNDPRSSANALAALRPFDVRVFYFKNEQARDKACGTIRERWEMTGGGEYKKLPKQQRLAQTLIVSSNGVGATGQGRQWRTMVGFVENLSLYPPAVALPPAAVEPTRDLSLYPSAVALPPAAVEPTQDLSLPPSAVAPPPAAVEARQQDVRTVQGQGRAPGPMPHTLWWSRCIYKCIPTRPDPLASDKDHKAKGSVVSPARSDAVAP